MGEMLHELENNEAVLLLYIAGELPEEDRREVEQMLTRSESLRQLHEELRAAYGQANAAIERLDPLDAASASTREAAARQFGRAVRAWHARRVAGVGAGSAVGNGVASGIAAPAGLGPAGQSPARSQPGRWPYPWWQTSGVAAAALLIGFLIWWGFVTDPVGGTPGGGMPGAGIPGPIADGRLPRPPVSVPPLDAPGPGVAPSEFDGELIAVSAIDLTGLAAGPALSEIESAASHLLYLSGE